MNPHTVFDWRNKRNINPISIQNMNYSSYSLPDFTENKNMNTGIYMYNQDFKMSEIEEKKIDDKSEKSESWLIKSALHMCAMIFRKISGRASSPDLSYHDCETVPGQDSPSMWHSAKTENKNIEAQSTTFAYTDRGSEMNGDYQSVVASCEDKLNKVRQLITSKPVPSSPKCTTYRSRRRRRVFVESSSVEDSFEDAFCPEDFITNSKSDPLTYVIPYQFQNCELLEVDAPKIRIETPVIGLTGPSVQENKEDLNLKPELVTTEVAEHIEPEKEEDNKNIETVSSCESKIVQLQAMLKERRKKNTKTMLNSSDSAPESVKDLPTENTKPKIIPMPKTQDKRYKNRHRISTGKRKKAETKKLIQDDMLFADEIAEDPSSFENSPIIPVHLSLDKVPVLDKSVENLGTTTEDCFDEVAGRFCSASGTESDDSFQVVFADSPRAMRPSDCESEDSFIFFEDSPDSCYTSNDVFGDESEYSDTDSEISDSGCGDSDELKMSQNMTKTFGDLTDDKLYDEDVVDSAVKMCVEISTDNLDLDAVSVKSTGLLLNDAKKQMRKEQPAKKVHFSEKPPKVHVMRVWAFAARQARAGHWERHALDRERFKRRIADADMALSWVLRPQHRSRVMFQRFMPWWNAQKRKELAEKKQRAADEKKRLEEEQIQEEQRLEEERSNTQEDTSHFGEDHKDEGEKIVNIDDKHTDINDKQNNIEDGNIKSNNLVKIDEICDKPNHGVGNSGAKSEKENGGAKNVINENTKLVSVIKRTNDLNKERSIKANTVNSVGNTQTEKVNNMEIILSDEKCPIIPIAVRNEVIS